MEAEIAPQKCVMWIYWQVKLLVVENQKKYFLLLTVALAEQNLYFAIMYQYFIETRYIAKQFLPFTYLQRIVFPYY